MPEYVLKTRTMSGREASDEFSTDWTTMRVLTGGRGWEGELVYALLDEQPISVRIIEEYERKPRYVRVAVTSGLDQESTEFIRRPYTPKSGIRNPHVHVTNKRTLREMYGIHDIIIVRKADLQEVS